MKNRMKLFLLMLLFHFVVLNNTKEPLFNIEFLIQGVTADPYDGELHFILYNYILNAGFMILLITTVLQAVSQTFAMGNYIITRCGKIKFKFVLLRVVLKEILAILIIKQMIYICFFLYTKSFTMFYFYDMGSTFLTLLLFAQCFSLFKLHGAKDKVPLFVIIGINMISQMLSYEHHGFSVITVASLGWQSSYLTNVIGKTVGIVVLSSMIYLQKDLDKMLGEKDS